MYKEPISMRLITEMSNILNKKPYNLEIDFQSDHDAIQLIFLDCHLYNDNYNKSSYFASKSYQCSINKTNCNGVKFN